MKKLYTVILLALIGLSVNAQNSWSSKTPFGGTARYAAVGFAIGDKLYLGFSDNNATDFWEYDINNNTWASIATFPGAGRYYAVGFSIGTKGYVGTGTNGVYQNDFWEYDPALNSWSSKTNFPGGARALAVGFSIGNKGYIGTGNNGSTFYNDFYEYNPGNNSWTQKTNLPDTARHGAVGFSIGTKGYIGTGRGQFVSYIFKSFWEYDQLSDSWVKKADFGGTARYYAIGFSIGNKGYIGTGKNYLNDFWEWNQATDTWIQKINYPDAVENAVGIATCTKGYIGTGALCCPTPTKNFAEYTPSATPAVGFTASQTTFCVGTCINFTDTSTNAPISWSWNFPGGNPGSSIAQNPTNICFDTAGTYTVSLTASDTNKNCSSIATKVITVNPIPATPGTISGNTSVCPGSSNTYSITAVSGATSYTWTKPSGWSGTTTTTTFTTTASSTSGNITVTANNSCGSSSAQTLAISVLSNSSFSQTDTICQGQSITVGGNTHSTNGTFKDTLTAANGCDSIVTTNLTVNSLPNITITGNTSICDSGSTTLTASGGISYSWNTGDTTASITDTPTSTTIYTVTVTDANGCSASKNDTVTVSTTPVATITVIGGTVYCEGDTTTDLLANPSGASYQWKRNGADISGATLQTLSVSSSGSYTVIVTKTGCSSNKSDTANISIFPLPDATIQRIGNLLISSAIGHFQWYRNDTLIPNDTMQTHSINNLCGSYKVEITDDNGCKAMSEKYDTCTTGIASITANNQIKISIHPNPFYKTTTIEISYSKFTKADLLIYDVLGQVVHQQTLNSKQETLNLNLLNGIYFYKINNERKEIIGNGKLMIQ